MIEIQVKLASVSLFSLAASIINVCPVVLGLLLATHPYLHARALQIPAALMAACSILCTIIQFFSVLFPYKLLLVAVNIATSTALAGSGMYFVSQRIRNLDDIAFSVSKAHNRMELAFVVLWLVALLTNFAIAFFSLGAIYLAYSGPENDVAGFNKREEEFYEKPPEMFANYPIPPLSGSTFPPSLSPRLTWPSSLESLGNNNNSIHSIESIGPIAFSQIHTPPQPVVPRDFTSSGLATPVLATPGLTEEPKPPKTPKSPLKIHLSHSSFSLRRAGSKASVSSPPPPPPPPLPSLPPQTLPHTLPREGLAIMQDNKNWVMIPNENIAEGRSVSGSSQLTGMVFPAAEYNRKLNSAGFQRDEPVPVHVEPVHNRNTISQYDLERIHQQSRTHP